MKNPNRFYVYELRDPISHVPFYVGKGTGNRLRVHQNAVKNWRKFSLDFKEAYNSFLFRKINKILEKGLEIEEVKILDKLLEKEAFALEMETIAKYRNVGIILCNLTDGGEGFSGGKGRSFSKEEREKVSKQFKGIPKTDEHKEKLRKSKLEKPTRYWKGKQMSEEHKENLRKPKSSSTGPQGPLSDEWKNNLSFSHKEFYSTAEGKRVVRETAEKIRKKYRKLFIFNGKEFIGNRTECRQYFHIGSDTLLKKIRSGEIKELEIDD